MGVSQDELAAGEPMKKSNMPEHLVAR